jgi:signal recognition particle subunit SRP19
MPGKSDKIIIWPVYFDSTKARSKGRAVSAQDAIDSPSLDDLINAARKAGFKPEVEKDKMHPAQWHESSGRILIEKTGPKSAVLKRISQALKTAPYKKSRKGHRS